MSEEWKLISTAIALLAFIIWMAKMTVKARKLHQQMVEEREMFNEFLKVTQPCPHCLGTGRAPKEGWEFSQRMKDKFNQYLELRKIPPAFREVFKKKMEET